MARIFQAAQGTRYELGICLALMLGLREGEIVALSPKDYSKGILHVRHTMVLDDDGNKIIKSTKTTAGDRKLPCPPHIRSLIEAVPTDQDRLCPMSAHALYKGFLTVCSHAGIDRHFRFHDLRHANASMLLAAGMPDKYAMERMGHSTTNMLKTVYQHTISEEQKRYNIAMEQKLSAIFGNEIGNEN